MIGIVDYGTGNVQALMTMFKRLGIEAFNARFPDDLQRATHLILPGVGAFDHAMTLLQRSEMQQALEEMVFFS